VFDLEKNIVLIGGTSHTGKSTLAESLAAQSGFKNISTDSLARHPGRPWKQRPEEIPLPVQQHYSALPVDELVSQVVKHYEKLWPLILSVIESYKNGLILEGSALLPKLIHQMNFKKIPAVWLTSTDSFLKDRIYKSSDYFNKSIKEKYLIDKFVKRTFAFNKMILKEAKQLNFLFLEVEKIGNVEDLANEYIRLIRKTQTP
jgi:2-phosphoglycerate kinase